MKKLIYIIASILVISCSNNTIKGEYHAQGLSVIGKLKFFSGGKVELSNMMKTSIGEYKLEGNRIIITANGDTVVFTMTENKNCIDGGGMLGIYCKK